MTRIFMLAIVATLLTISQARSGAFLMNAIEYTTTNIKCLMNSGYSRIGVMINFNGSSIKNKDLFNLNIAYIAGSTTTDIILSFCTGDYPNSASYQFASKVQPKMYDRLYLYAPSYGQPCAWPVDPANPSKLNNHIVALGNEGIDQRVIGITANANEWKQTFGNSARFNNKDLFWLADQADDDFVSFGGWSKPYIELLDTVSACGVQFTKYYFV